MQSPTKTGECLQFVLSLQFKDIFRVQTYKQNVVPEITKGLVVSL